MAKDRYRNARRAKKVAINPAATETVSANPLGEIQKPPQATKLDSQPKAVSFIDLANQAIEERLKGKPVVSLTLGNEIKKLPADHLIRPPRF